MLLDEVISFSVGKCISHGAGEEDSDDDDVAANEGAIPRISEMAAADLVARRFEAWMRAR